ncbi:MAG: hypothetical protein GOU98_01020, partial [Candidatus Altiarchaeota archaeon]|nr:hypothetical protein [Candidatus Altiarchaeota archaeon]
MKFRGFLTIFMLLTIGLAYELPTYTLEFGDFLIFDSFEIEVGQILPYTI